MCMNDYQRDKILFENIKTLEDSIEAIKQNKSDINVIIKELERVKKKLENQKEEFFKKISKIEENFKNEIKKLRDEFKHNGLNESLNTEKNNFNNSSEEMFPSKLEDKKEGKEGSNLNSENANQETKLKEENKRLEEENKRLKKEKEEEIGKKDKRISEIIKETEKLEREKKEEIGERDRRILELTEKNKKLEKEKKEKIDEIKSRDVKINDLNFKINNLLREKTDLEKNVADLRREILSKNQTITRLENQVSSLTEDVRNREHKISGLENDKNKLENDKNNLISRLADFKDLEELEDLYSEYLKIPENDREKYDAILKPHLGKDMFLYLVTTKFSNYKDFLKNDFIENADFYAVLVKIYDYVINVMNKEYDEEVYEFVNPEIGERYNPISQIPSSNSVSNGDVARVIVKGYQRKRDKKLLYQSIVLLK